MRRRWRHARGGASQTRSRRRSKGGVLLTSGSIPSVCDGDLLTCGGGFMRWRLTGHEGCTSGGGKAWDLTTLCPRAGRARTTSWYAHTVLHSRVMRGLTFKSVMMCFGTSVLSSLVSWHSSVVDRLSANSKQETVGCTHLNNTLCNYDLISTSPNAGGETDRKSTNLTDFSCT